MKTPTAVVVSVIGLTLLAGTAAAANPIAGTPGGGAAGGPLSVTGPPNRLLGAPHAVVPAAQSPARSTIVTLLTGDKIRLDPGPNGTVNATPVEAGKQSDFVEFGWGGDQYVIPDSAAPYLSSTLDWRLFDVSYLARAGLDDAHSTTLPVAITTGGGAAASALPGAHISATSGATATATLGKAQAAQFGHLLAQQWRSSRIGASSAPVGTLPGISRIALAPAAGAPALPAAPSQPAKPAGTTGTGLHFHTLTINTIDLNGNPGTAVGFVQNVDDARLGTFPLNFPGQQGPVSFSVPDGTYSFEISVLTGPADDLTAKSALVIKPEVTVKSNMTVTLDARTAKPYQPTLQTPPPDGTARQDLLTFDRQAATGGGLRAQAFGFDGALILLGMRLFSNADTDNRPLYATPTPAISTGTLNFSAFTELSASDTDSQGQPRYELAFPSRGSVPSSLTYQVPDASLTTVHSTIYDSACAECTGTDELFPMVYLPWAIAQLGVGANVPSGEHTDYWYSSAPDLTVWQNAFNANDGSRRWGARRETIPGQRINEVWNNTSSVPSPAAPYLQSASIGLAGSDAVVNEPLAVVCAACRQDDNAVLHLQPAGDSDPSHFATPEYGATPSLRFWRNGTLVVSSDGTKSGTLAPTNLPLPLLPTAATYRLDWAWTDVGNAGTSSDTEWNFHSSPTDASSLPSNEVCTPDPTRSCSFLPLLFARYDLPLNFQSNAKAAAPFQLTFTVSTQQNAPAPTGVAATVSVSYDDGATWSAPQDAQATGGGGFTTAITHPDLADTNGFVSLRVHAQNAAGNTVDQTTIRAYGLTN